ncbi:type II CRISPR-associated endonuclease Cas1 [uncultured Anaerovibrio sp.]|uniref:type II CRISPR-associated endonuclease Cas1 n=1 Tax=uncultured Anaerovibrio sp. TaxID=361586 RepID=UPI0025FC1A24|nr:type II CRISPR-associated endonuclease Cas1 [uncultured Anaerovibrio sp.]
MYLPTAVMLPFEGNARQAKIMHAQVTFSKEQYEQLWIRIIKYKINNQARVLNILGELGSDIVAKYGASISVENVDYNESLAAKEYFKYYRDGLNRRIDDPINSRLNYGYAVVRSAIIRALVTAGFHPAFGIHHNNQLNLYNLADDLIEPYRQIVDLLASQNVGESNVLLSKAERKNMASVLHIACSLDGIKMNVMSAIEMTVDSLKRILVKGLKEELLLPCVLPVESIGGITE